MGTLSVGCEIELRDGAAERLNAAYIGYGQGTVSATRLAICAREHERRHAAVVWRTLAIWK